MHAQVRVSAIVPVYNVAEYLEQCVVSLLDQTHPFVEIVLVDDGSTDGSEVLCDRLAAKHPSVKVVHKANEGLGYARNTGLDNLEQSSDYVMFVDSDDWLENDAVAKLSATLGSVPADIVLSGHMKKGADGKTLFVFRLDDERYEHDIIREELIPRLCGSSPSGNDSLPMSACSNLYRRSLIERESVRFPSEREMISEDFVFNFAMFLHAEIVVTCSYVGYNYRTSQGSLTTRYRQDRFEACLRFYNTCCEMIASENLPEECLMRLTKSFFIYLRMCINQERLKIKDMRYRDALQNVRWMVGNGTVKNAIRSYPIAKLGFKQRLFLNMVQKRRCRLLLLCAVAGVLK